MHTLTIRLTDDQWSQLRTLAYRTNERYNSIVVLALNAYLQQGQVDSRVLSTPNTDLDDTTDRKG